MTLVGLDYPKKREPDLRSSFSGKKLFERGNSPAQLLPAVVKLGVDERARGEYVKFLGPQVCPEVYSTFSNGYAMEMLQESERNEDSLRMIEALLIDYVWSRPALSLDDDDWQGQLRLRIRTPDYPDGLDVRNLTHGDCTLSNLMSRMNGGYVLVDALPPRPHVAQCPQADMGRILQSAAGWETFRYGDEYVPMRAPAFWEHDYMRQRALWWCGATALRIATFGEPSDRLLLWCEKVAEVSFDAARV